MNKINTSRNTLDLLKHYVSVRLQQGVPLVDADFNEAHDIRRFEIQAFLKWFIGNGVPAGNDGFRIMPIKNRVILRWAKEDWNGKKPIDSSLRVILEEDTTEAAHILGFDESNSNAKRVALPVAQLTGNSTPDENGNFDFGNAPKTLRIQVDDAVPVDIQLIGEMTPLEAAAEINDKVLNLFAKAGEDNDFDIKGWGGPGEGAGICLVDGWDVRNETSVNYQDQPGVSDSFKPLDQNTEYFVYLDVWESEIGPDDDRDHLINPLIDEQTCWRLKREWLVRVIEASRWGGNSEPPPNYEPDHVYYRLARISMKGEVEIKEEHITDLRRKMLASVAESELVKILLRAQIDDEGDITIHRSFSLCGPVQLTRVTDISGVVFKVNWDHEVDCLSVPVISLKLHKKSQEPASVTIIENQSTSFMFKVWINDITNLTGINIVLY